MLIAFSVSHSKMEMFLSMRMHIEISVKIQNKLRQSRTQREATAVKKATSVTLICLLYILRSNEMRNKCDIHSDKM